MLVDLSKDDIHLILIGLTSGVLAPDYDDADIPSVNRLMEYLRSFLK